METPDCASGYLASIEQLEATGSRAHLGMLSGLLAGQFLRLGLLNDAAKLLTMAIADGDRTGNRWYHSELHRLRAEVSLAALDLRTAEAGFRDAIMLAREHGARWFELRAMSGLTQLQRNQGKIDDARSQQTVHSMGHGDVALASLLSKNR
ncbi:hypothetical protein [Cupriavidus sp. D39]|uniref:hypothetical protein n=1 Tax=Cupriavidus sp. D39 TaxID=2997877 RepID=UPI00226E8A0E|nr:hypothetical protein [Cupriavidus sp. D39]MCY0852575.1 hypothetical protein [Cupriavidus sp. D39]